MTIVWIVESGAYEQRCIDLVAEDLSVAIAAIKAKYRAPYVVRWDEPQRYGLSKDVTMAGHFDAVPGYSERHTKRYTITPHEVLAGT